MQESAIKAWNKKKRKEKTHSQPKTKTTVPDEITARQEQIKTLLKKSCVKTPWDLPVTELYAVRALQLGAVL